MGERVRGRGYVGPRSKGVRRVRVGPVLWELVDILVEIASGWQN